MNTRPHVPWLSHMRGLSSLVVCAAHTYNAMVSPVTGLEFTGDKWMGALSYLAVYVFFVISGYSIALSILSNTDRNAGRFAAREFAADRLARLVPPLVAALLVTVGVYLLVVGLALNGAGSYQLGGEKFLLRNKVALGWKDIATPLAFLQTVWLPHGVGMNGSLWSLSFEFWFYVMAGLFTLVAVNRDPRAALLLLLLGTGYYYSNGTGRFHLWYLPVWCAGCLMAVGYHYERLSARPLVRALLAALALASVAVLVRAVARYGVTVFDVYRPGVPTPLVYAALSVVIALLCGSAAVGRLGLGRVFNWASEYSYTLYVVHFPLLLLAMSLFRPVTHGWGFGPMLAVGTGVFVAINAFAYLLSRVVENRRTFRPVFQRAVRALAPERLSGAVTRALFRRLRHVPR